MHKVGDQVKINLPEAPEHGWTAEVVGIDEDLPFPVEVRYTGEYDDGGIPGVYTEDELEQIDGA